MMEMSSPLLPTATFSGAAIRRLSAGTLAKPAPRPNTPPRKPMAANTASPAGVWWVRQSTCAPRAGSSKRPFRRSSSPSGSDSSMPSRSLAFDAPDQQRDADHGDPQRGLQQVGGNREPDQRPRDRGDRAGQRERHHQAQVGHAAAQEHGTRGERARQREQQAGAAHEIEVKRKEAGHHRHEQHPAADARDDRDDAEHEGDREQRDRPYPPCDRGGVYTMHFALC